MRRSPEPVTAEALVGLLAEDDRLRVVAALALGAGTVAEVAASAGLDGRRTVLALERLAGGRLVEEEKGRLRLVSELFKQAAREAAANRAAKRPPEDFDGPPEDAAVLRNFVREGRLVSIPAARSKRLVVLDWLAGRFEPGRVYPESEVSASLATVNPDHAALRRHLVDEGFLERRDSFYWRAGGSFEID